MPSLPYRQAVVFIPIPKASSDGLYWGRYPQGNRPVLTGVAGVTAAATGVLGGGATDATADSASITADSGVTADSGPPAVPEVTADSNTTADANTTADN